MEPKPIILVIDDNLNNIKVVVDYLKESGYETAVARSGPVGITRAGLLQPDLILLDIMMPDMDGFEACRHLKANPETTDIPVIFMTALNTIGDKVQAFAQGGVDYITKPAQREEVLARVTTHVQLRRQASELEVARREAETARQEAERANRAKSDFLANMSHELRTPLNGILGYAQILKRDPHLDQRQQDGLGIIEQSGRHLLMLINDVLDLAKVEAGKIELDESDVYLPVFVKGVADIMQIRADQKQVAFHVDVAEESALPLYLLVDERRVRQVLLNLLGNAVKFTPAGGEVTLRIEYCRAACHPPRLRFIISDTGPGIAADELESIFSPFQQAGNHRHHEEGTGLGLAISRTLAGLMGGRLHVESVPGRGSTFHFEIPVRHTSPAHTQQRAAAGPITGYAGEPRMLLVIDDHDQNRRMLVDALTPLGFTALEAADCEEGLKIAAEQEPGAILLDLYLPGLDGFTCLQHLRRHRALAQTPILACSANVQPSIADRARKAGADAFLPKPLELDDLLSWLQTVLQIEWQRTQTAPVEEFGPSAAIPQAEVLSALRESAESGDLEELRVQLHALRDAHAEYRHFADRLLDLTRQFKLDAIEATLSDHLTV